MFDVHSDLGVTGADPFESAYERFIAALESAWPDESQTVANAYQAYTSACEQALSDPLVQDQVSAALNELTDALSYARGRPEARALVDEAARSYLNEVGAAWSELRPDEQGVEALLALATGMTTLAWLFGLGSSPQVTPFGLGGGLSAGGSSFGALGDTSEHDDPPDPAFAPEASDDIVWQEFDVGENGEIIQRAAKDSVAAAPPPAADGNADGARAQTRPSPPRARNGAAGSAGTTSRNATDADPLARARRAYSDYVDGVDALNALGIPNPHVATDAADVNQRTNELLGSYLRLLYGSGSWPDLYGGYARLLESTTELLQRQTSLAQSYEHALQVALRRHEQMRSAADRGYQRLVGALRDAWSEVDPATLSPRQLAELAELTQQAATFREATTPTDWSRPPR